MSTSSSRRLISSVIKLLTVIKIFSPILNINHSLLTVITLTFHWTSIFLSTALYWRNILSSNILPTKFRSYLFSSWSSFVTVDPVEGSTRSKAFFWHIFLPLRDFPALNWKLYFLYALKEPHSIFCSDTFVEVRRVQKFLLSCTSDDVEVANWNSDAHSTCK